MHLIERLKTKLASAIGLASGHDADAGLLEYPEDPKNGDLAFPCFSLAKPMGKNPAVIASELAETISLQKESKEYLERVESKGPYLNFFFDRSELFSNAMGEALEKTADRGPRTADRRRERIMVEYVSPNNNKPLHLGHVRNGLLGASVSALLEKRGAEVVRTMILNDRGLSISKSMAAYAKWHEGETPEGAGKKSDAYVGDLYVEFEKGSKDDPSLVDEAHELIRKWEEGDKKTRALWKKLDGWVEEGHARSFERLGFRFDVVDRESDVYLEGKRIVEEGLERGAFERDGTGAVIARLEAHGLPDKVMLRADGTSVYITQDLALAKKRFERDGIDRLIYVVGNEQDLHFRQLFKILELLGREWASKLSHLSYGYVRLPEGRMKSREGTIVEADDLLDALEKDAAEAVKERHAGLDEDEVARRARIIAGGALKYHFLEVDPASDMVYDPKASLSFTGRTGPYLQYMHARIRSIIRKAESPGTSYESDSARAEVLSERSESKEPSHRSVSDEEHALAKLLARYPETVELAADGLKPSLVAHHLYELAKAFAAFYENVPVLEAPGPERAARLALVRAVERVLNEGLSLLGIDAPEEM